MLCLTSSQTCRASTTHHRSLRKCSNPFSGCSRSSGSVLAVGAGSTAEFPFYDAGPAVPHAGTGEGTGTALLLASGTEKNPRLGSGLLLRLCLPLVLGAESANRLANNLNLAEAREWTETHLLGSWCTKGTDVCFVCFVPAMVGLGLEPAQRAILVYNLVASMGVRAKWVKEYLAAQKAGPAHTEAETQQVGLEWSGFTRALASSLEQLRVDQFLILNSHGYYVQFAQHGPRGLLAESVSNRFLEDFELLSSDGEKRLQELGWVEPGKMLVIAKALQTGAKNGCNPCLIPQLPISPPRRFDPCMA